MCFCRQASTPFPSPPFRCECQVAGQICSFSGHPRVRNRSKQLQRFLGRNQENVLVLLRNLLRSLQPHGEPRRPQGEEVRIPGFGVRRRRIPSPIFPQKTRDDRHGLHTGGLRLNMGQEVISSLPAPQKEKFRCRSEENHGGHFRAGKERAALASIGRAGNGRRERLTA
jgi:hypothetical protein